MMMKELLAALGVSLAVVTIFADTSASSQPMTLRSSVDGRLWQTVFAPSEPLRWRWAETADSATVAFVDMQTGRTVGSRSIERGAGDYGSTAIPVPDFASTGEVLYEVTLSQMANDAEVESTTAKLACLKSCNSFDLLTDRQSSAWCSSVPNRLIPYDRTWSGTTSGTVTFRAASGANAASAVQEGKSGWVTFAPKKMLGLSSGSFDVSLLTDEGVFATATIKGFPLGSLLLFR